MSHIPSNPNSEEITRKTARAIIEYLLEHPEVKKKKLNPIKCRYCKKYGFINVIKNSKIAEYATEEESKHLRHLLNDV